MLFKKLFQDFPGGSVAKTPHSQRRGPGSISGQGAGFHMLQLQILHATAKDSGSTAKYINKYIFKSISGINQLNFRSQ